MAHQNATSKPDGAGHRGRRLVLILVGFVILAFFGVKAWRANQLATGIIAEGRELEQITKGGDLGSNPAGVSELTTQLSRLEEDLHALRGELGLLVNVAPALGWMPEYGSDLSQAPALFDFSGSAVHSARLTLQILNEVNTKLDVGRASGEPLGRSAVDAISEQKDQISIAQNSLAQTLALRSMIDASHLSTTSSKLVGRIDTVLPDWKGGLDAMALAPELLGADHPREYIVMVQNSDELRPTGGFISSIVRVRVEHGDITGLDFKDSYAIDNPATPHPPPPAPLAKYMNAGAWYLRDANWSPDLPTTARDFFTLYGGAQSDGVIATNLNLVENLLEASGPVTIPGTGERIDADNALAVMQAHYESPQGEGQTGDWWAHRKDFNGKLLVTILDRMRDGEFDHFKMAQALAHALNSKDLMFYMNDADVQAKVEAAGWAGKLDQKSGDSIEVIDANLGFNKVDPNIVRNFRYAVKLDATGTGQSEVILNYQNLSPSNGAPCVHAPYYGSTYAELQQGCYWDYIRVAAAPNAKLAQENGGAATGDEAVIGDRPVANSYLVLPKGESREVKFEYSTPNLLSEGKTYRLRIEKQPGAPQVSWKVEIQLPDEWTDLRADPSPQSMDGHKLEYQFAPDGDKEITIERESNLASNSTLIVALAGVTLIGAGALWMLVQRRHT